MQALVGVRVVELANDIAAAIAGRLLAERGADVVKVERPEGDPARRDALLGDPSSAVGESSLFLYLNQGKRSAVADTADAAGRDLLAAVLVSADVLLTDWSELDLSAAGIGVKEITRLNPRLIVTSVSPFGSYGPYATYRATSIVAYAIGGQMSLTGDPAGPPMKTYGHQAEYQAGLHAFAATALCLFDRARGNPPQRVEIAGVEVQTAAVQHMGPLAYQHGVGVPRLGNVSAPTWGIFECDGGYAGVFALPGNYAITAEAMSVAKDEAQRLFAVDGDILACPDELEATVRAWCYGRTPAEVHAIGGATGAPLCAVLTVPELLEWPALTERGFWRQAEHPAVGGATYPGPALRGGASTPPLRPAPLLGEHTAEITAERPSPVAPPSVARVTAAPLEGVRVLDLSLVWSGPYATALLAEMGAEVIKVEGPLAPDIARILSPITEAERTNGWSPYFQQHNRGKLGFAVDLKKAEGREVLLALVAASDVLLENYRAGVLDRLGLDYETLRSVNPRLVVCSMPGFGSEGSERDRAAYGPVVEAMSGLASLGGIEGGPPLGSGVSYGDPLAAATAAGAIILGLLDRERTGAGQRIELSQRDNMIAMIGEVFVEYSRSGKLPPRLGNRHPVWAPQGCYPCRRLPAKQGAPRFGGGEPLNEQWLVLSVTNDDEWRSLCEAMGTPNLAADPQLRAAAGRRERHDEIDAAIADWTRTRDSPEAAEILQRAGVPAGPVLHPVDLSSNPHLLARGFFESPAHPSLGVSRVTGPVWRLSATPMHHRRAAPLLGEHTAEILQRVVGLTRDESAGFAESGAIV